MKQQGPNVPHAIIIALNEMHLEIQGQLQILFSPLLLAQE